MSTLVTSTKAAHWYNREGKPYHTIVGANGKERDTTLRDARKLGLYPSVTSVLDVIAKPGLNAWIVEQGILSSLTLPRDKDELDDSFAKRVVADMNAHRDNAAALGTRIHNAIDQTLSGLLPDPEMTPYLDSVGKWFTEAGLKPISIEADMVSLEWGFGGRIDLCADVFGVPALIDFKSQEVKKGKPNFYESWPLQLSAYRQMLQEKGQHIGACYSVIIDTAKGPHHVKAWTDDELHFETFAAAFMLWKYLKGYEPLGTVEVAP